MTDEIREDGHWRREDYTQRMTRAQWRKLLLEHQDHTIFEGRYRQLAAKHIGVGVMEVSKVPLTEKEKEL